MKSIRWTSLARDDLVAIDTYWWTNNSMRADEILARIKASAEFLQSLPNAGPPLDDYPARKWSVRQTPYLLIYRIVGDEIEILRVHHGNENWMDIH